MMDASDLFTLARTVYGEARGESDQGRAAVAHVVLNRFRSDKWFSAGTIEAVCRKPSQFSCWNNDYFTTSTTVSCLIVFASVRSIIFTIAD